ncbi:MAG: Histidine--tRNA ligase [candidate division WS2 bacterium]|uniref:Histidine--tRNA ligase n=1 Tax=Psychracetigena formicireducens TaxID=2986056 RepID=A0A9E2BEX5_PSYF1|nr:Histidine--tRNA ligase [Candidatus Psychracetigena formicireducens]MBT9144338.1 Histidine--tRNA ligase [Candidatus Psychracetigena formicireducens]
MEYRAPRGTRDILPPESEGWDIILSKLTVRAEEYGYKKVIFPTFEHTELFKRGIGEDTDIVQKEMYTFQDRKGRWLTLRPEGTASLARLFVEKGIDKFNGVSKYYYFGSMFRYERPQSGRYREFYHFGVEALGSDSPYLDVELISLCKDTVESFAIKDYLIYINSIGCSECRSQYILKLGGLLKQVIAYYCEDCRRRVTTNTLRVLDCKIDKHRNAELPILSDNLCPSCSQHYDEVKKGLQTLNINWQENPNLVRGLDYYNRTVFELVTPYLGESTSILGGGRYDQLISCLGGKETPGVGFALGFDRLYQVVYSNNPDFLNSPRKGVYISSPETGLWDKVFRITFDLRNRGLKAECNYQNRSLKSQVKTADKDNYEFFLTIFQKDMVLKNLTTGEEKVYENEEEEKVLVLLSGKGDMS